MMVNPFLPVELVFNLLCVCRRAQVDSPRSIRNEIKRRGLYFGNLEGLPPISFWIRLCQSAWLLDEETPPYPTLATVEWLMLPLHEQIHALLKGWLRAPLSSRLKRARQQLLDHLASQAALGTIHRRELTGLQALGMVEGEHLSELGRSILDGVPMPARPAENWRLEGDQLVVPYPPDWALLWELDSFLEPAAPGLYPLGLKALRKAAQRGALARRAEDLRARPLPTVIESGLGMKLPDKFLESLSDQPVVRLLPGPVLEFDDPRELLSLRKSPAWRRELQDVLSPRYVHLEPRRAQKLIKRLVRKGLLGGNDLEAARRFAPFITTKKEGGEAKPWRRGESLSTADRTYLLALLLLAEGLRMPFAPPPGLFNKLAGDLNEALRAVAARKASEALSDLSPSINWIPEDEHPPLPEEELIEKLEQAIRKEEPVDVLYQASGRAHPEYRRLTPLLVEQRGLRYYLLAYCHSRKTNRTFRLDRLQWIEIPPD